MIAAVRVRGGLPVVVFLAVALAQSLALAQLAMRPGATSLYLPFKMMYLAVFPGAVLGALVLIWFTDAAATDSQDARFRGSGPRGRRRCARRRPRAARAAESPINAPSYAVGLWARANVPPACVDYFSTHWLTGYWLHLDVFGNPRDSDRMHAESFELPRLGREVALGPRPALRLRRERRRHPA